MLFFGKPDIYNMEKSKNIKGLEKVLNSKNPDLSIKAARALWRLGWEPRIDDDLKHILRFWLAQLYLNSSYPVEYFRDNSLILEIPHSNPFSVSYYPSDRSGTLAARVLVDLSNSIGIDKSALIEVIVPYLESSIENFNMIARSLSEGGQYSYYRTDDYYRNLVWEYKETRNTICNCIAALEYIGDPKVIPRVKGAVGRIGHYYVSSQYNLSDHADTLPALQLSFWTDRISGKR